MTQYSYDFMPQPPQQQYNWLDTAGLSGTAPQGSAPQGPALNVPYSFASANGTLPVAAPRGGILGGLGKIGGWMGKNAQAIGAWGNLAMNGINAYIGLQQLGLAKDAFKLEEAAFKTNLANQVDSYNTQMRDRTTGRWYATEEERQAALKEAELPQGMRG